MKNTTNIELIHNKGFKRFSNGKIFVKGFAFDKDNFLFRDKQLIKYFDINTQDEVINKLKNSNGFFSVVIETDNTIYAAVDRLRTFPLFYALDNEDFHISDNFDKLKKKNFLDNNNAKSNELDAISEDEFLFASFVSGADTLYHKIKQLQAGELLIYNKTNKILKTVRYFKLQHKKYSTKAKEELFDELDKVHINVFKRLIESTKGKTIVVPLSGGYDSRLIVYMLKKFCAENVITFSYGIKYDNEVKISKKTAAYFGYKWLFIPYSRKKWYDWFHCQEFEDFLNYAVHGSSFAHTQDYPAVKIMKDKELIPENSVFVPGHTGDFITGGHIPDVFFQKKEFSYTEIKNAILKKHYRLWKFDDVKKIKEKFYEKIITIIGKEKKYSAEKAAEKYEFWEWQERQVKYICNSVRVYDFFNYEWQMPLWDNEIINFWSKIPLNYKRERNLYKTYYENRQKIPVSISKDTILLMFYHKYFYSWYGRFNGNMNTIKALNFKIGDIENCNLISKPYIDKLSRIVNANKVGLNSLSQLIHIKNQYKKTNIHGN